MPKIKSVDGTALHYEEAGAGTPVVFVHEFAGDYRTWEPQMRAFSRSHRCVTFSARGYPPSDMPNDPSRYGQDIARGDVVAIMERSVSAKRISSAIPWAPTRHSTSASATPSAASR